MRVWRSVQSGTLAVRKNKKTGRQANSWLFSLAGNSRPGVIYRVESSFTMTPGSRSIVSEQNYFATGPAILAGLSPDSAPHLFYRVTVPAIP